jgi:hypothetical protein
MFSLFIKIIKLSKQEKIIFLLLKMLINYFHGPIVIIKSFMLLTMDGMSVLD